MKKVILAISMMCFAHLSWATNEGKSNHASAKQNQVQTQSSKNVNSVLQVVSTPQSVTVTNDSKRIPVSTALGSALTVSNGSCMGSASGGAQGMSVGLSFGSTYKDEDCNRRYNAQHLMALGKNQAALALMCQDSAVAEAIKVSGDSCPKVAHTTVETRTSEVEYKDPYIRRRLGLAPL